MKARILSIDVQILFLTVFVEFNTAKRIFEAQSIANQLSVVFIVGGYQRKVEIYSPDGSCQHQLAPVPIDGNYFTSPILAFINNSIIACGGYHENQMCWIYQPEQDRWLFKTNSSFSHSGMPGCVYGSKLYVLDDNNPEVFDWQTNRWSLWPVAPAKIRWGSCMVSWRNSFYVFGGRDHPKMVQRFNHLTQRWTIVNNSSSPIMMLYSSCTVLPTDEILIVGSSFLNYTRFSAIYNPISNKWKAIGNGHYDRQGSNVVRLGHKIYVLGGGENPPTEEVEELHPCFNLWTSVKYRMTTHRRNFGTLSVPAKLFRHLGCDATQIQPTKISKLIRNYFERKELGSFPDFEYNGPNEGDFPSQHPYSGLLSKVFIQ